MLSAGKQWGVQVAALAGKNFILSWRAKRATACELLAPLAFMLLLGILELSVQYPSPDASVTPLLALRSGDGPLPCRVFDDEHGRHGYGLPIQGAWCVPMLFAPTTSPEVVEVMEELAVRNGYRSPVTWERPGGAPEPCGVRLGYQPCEAAEVRERKMWGDDPPAMCGSVFDKCMLGFSSVSEMSTWLRLFPGRAGIAVNFGAQAREHEGYAQGTGSNFSVVDYEVWYNMTALALGWYARAGLDPLAAASTYATSRILDHVKDTSYVMSAQRMVDEAILAWHAAANGSSRDAANLEVQFQEYPRVAESIGQTVSQVFGAVFLYMALMFSFLVTLNRLVSEKENRTMQAMRSMGLADSAYWASYWVQVRRLPLSSLFREPLLNPCCMRG